MIVLVQINFSEDHSEKILPLGILSVGSALKKNNHEVKLFNINEKEINGTVLAISNLNPLYVGISVMTGMQTEHSATLSKKIKEIKDIPILWGGIHPSLLPVQCLNEKYLDYVIVGEGEETILEFTEALLSNNVANRLPSILGLGYKKTDGSAMVNPCRPLIEDLDKWRLDFSLLDMNKYVYKLGPYKKVIAYKSSRGCPFNCGFCYNNEFNKGRWRVWSIKNVVEDINFLKEKYQIDAVKFYDDNFFVDKKRAYDILEAIDLPSHLEVRSDFIDDEIAAKLKSLKVFDMLIGLESGSDRLLQLIDKRFKVSRLLDGVKSIAKYDLHATYSFIVGLPTETKEEFKQTIDLMYELYKIHPKAGFTMGAYLPYPGSRMFEFSLQNGFKMPVSTEEWGKIDRFRKNFDSPWVDAKRVWIIRECFKIMSWDFIVFKKWFEFRIKHYFYFWPLDIYLIEFLANVAIEEKNIFGKVMRRMYNFVRTKHVGDIGPHIKFNRGKLLSGIIYPEFFKINQNDEVLNVGCGDGPQAVLYKDSFKHMVGVDINKDRLDKAEQVKNFFNINNFEFICANVEDIPLEKQFDKVIAVDIVEHVIHPDKLVSEIHRLLKSDGELLMTFPAMHDKWELFFRFIGRKILRRKGKPKKEGWDPDVHQYDYSLKQWIKLLEDGGFVLAKARGSTLFPPLHYYGLPRFWFTNSIIHSIDNWLCQLPFLKNYGQALVCVFIRGIKPNEIVDLKK